jgi:S-formylglutathione hydrolase FrmB
VANGATACAPKHELPVETLLTLQTTYPLAWMQGSADSFLATQLAPAALEAAAAAKGYPLTLRMQVTGLGCA